MEQTFPEAGRLRLCRVCQTRPCSAARARQHDYRCNPCRKQTPAYRDAEWRYRRTEKRMATRRELNRNRIYIGKRYHSAAKTAEQAQRINALIKEQLFGFKQRQSAGAHREDHSSR